MKESNLLRVLLLLSGSIAVVVGLGLLFFPVAFHALSGIALGNDASLLSETRAPGGGLLVTGLLILAGSFMRRLTFTSTVLSASIYLAYGVSRLWSMAVDGLPSANLVQVTVAELVVGVACAFALVRYRKSHTAA